MEYVTFHSIRHGIYNYECITHCCIARNHKKVVAVAFFTCFYLLIKCMSFESFVSFAPKFELNAKVPYVASPNMMKKNENTNKKFIQRLTAARRRVSEAGG